MQLLHVNYGKIKNGFLKLHLDSVIFLKYSNLRNIYTLKIQVYSCSAYFKMLVSIHDTTPTQVTEH